MLAHQPDGAIFDGRLLIGVEAGPFERIGKRIDADRLDQQFVERLLDLRAADLEDRGFRTDAASLLLRRQRAQIDDLQRAEPCLHLAEAGAEPRVVGERAVIRPGFNGSDLLQPLDLHARLGDAGDARALVAQQELGIGPAPVLLADAVRHRHAHIGEEHLVEIVPAVHGDDRPHLDAGAVHVDQQEGDALLLLRGLRVGAHQREDPVRIVRAAGPDLGAVDDILVAVAHGAGPERGEVGAGAGFRIALAPEHVALQDRRQVLRLLRFAAEGVDDRPHHHDAEGREAGRVMALVGFLEDEFLRRRPAGAAMLLRPVGRNPALLVKRLLPAPHVLLGDIGGIAPDLLGKPGLQIGPEEGVHLLGEGALAGREFKLHGTKAPAYGKTGSRRFWKASRPSATSLCWRAATTAPRSSARPTSSGPSRPRRVMLFMKARPWRLLAARSAQ